MPQPSGSRKGPPLGSLPTTYHHKAVVSYFRTETGIFRLHSLQFYTWALQHTHPGHLIVTQLPPPRSSSSQGNSPRPVPPNTQRHKCHVRRCPGRGLLSSSQTPLTSPDDWGDRPVSGTHQSVLTPSKCM